MPIKKSRKASRKINKKQSRKTSKKVVKKQSKKMLRKGTKKATRRYRMTDREIMETGRKYGEKVASGVVKARKGYQTVKTSVGKGVSKVKELYGKVKETAAKAKTRYDITKAGVKGAIKGYKETVAVQEAYRNVFPDYFKAPRLF